MNTSILLMIGRIWRFGHLYFRPPTLVVVVQEVVKLPNIVFLLCLSLVLHELLEQAKKSHTTCTCSLRVRVMSKERAGRL